MSQDLLVIVPSRGRPQNIQRLLQAWTDTAATAQLEVAVDDDDPMLSEYLRIMDHLEPEVGPLAHCVVGERLRLGPTLNARAVEAARLYRYVGFMGDDHLPRTNAWDDRITDHLADLRTGIVYGNDLLQGQALPTAVFMTADVIDTLGYFSPPELIHMYLDDAWKAWGEGMGRLRYLDDVVIEHMHPVAGKADGDVLYGESNAVMGKDSIAYDHYKVSGELHADIAKLTALAAS